jgi:glycine dehydrogenase
MMRYLKNLERKDVGLDRSMIPLGSCTMKLNAASEMIPVTWPEFSAIHPFAPLEPGAGLRAGHQRARKGAGRNHRVRRGVAAAQLRARKGELAGLMAIRAYHRSRGDAKRTVVLIPASAHGTNPQAR